MNSRALSVSIAAVLMVLLSLANLASLLLPSEGVPEVVIYLSIVLGVAGLVAASGLSMLRKWSIWLTIVVSLLNLLSAAPGIPFGPNTALQAAAAVTVVASALIIVLGVMPTSRRAFVAVS
jgi:hypothetical protein